ncbi:MAG: hypothetical protein WC631_03355 [Candidatus Paceibacterota bacterium]|jgi:hypothetical protein
MKKIKYRFGRKVFYLVNFEKIMHGVKEVRQKLISINLDPCSGSYLSIIRRNSSAFGTKRSFATIGLIGSGKYIILFGNRNLPKGIYSHCDEEMTFHKRFWFVCNPRFPGPRGVSMVLIVPQKIIRGTNTP